MYEKCPVNSKSLAARSTSKSTSRAANKRDALYAEWHAEHGQSLRRKYRVGKQYKNGRA